MTAALTQIAFSLLLPRKPHRIDEGTEDRTPFINFG